MRTAVDRRLAEGGPDEVWFVEHPPVITLGRRGETGGIIAADGIPVVHSDRGGDVTYHGPGQLVVYPMLDLSRLGLGVRELVQWLQRIIIEVLAGRGVAAELQDGAPGVYVGAAKIASVGLRIRRRISYHGISLNVDMDLGAFHRIHPCGREALKMTQLSELCTGASPGAVADEVEACFARRWRERCPS
ncbi:MAG: lipoyl(octanoyl) transferase LipB [Gammaproteobacteria bacterium AqS3]|nr:lipoyl(octanoyl) transferase LipB [Gammaproteobacteria bacterium AqS3]